MTGTLAAPYANQELRPSRASDIELLGTAAVPAAVDRLGSGLGETVEGTLARISGVIERTDASSSGSITVTVEDESGEIKVFLHAGSGAQRAQLKPGIRLTATGIVGQRESSSGAGDGYRLWPRDARDLVLGAAATPTPGPGSTPAPTPTPRPTVTPRPTTTASPAPRVRRIADLATGDVATIEGTVTTPAGLLDGDGRRVAVQDASGAIMVRLPEGAAAPRLGTRIRATGTVGTYYDAPQLAVDDAIATTGRRGVAPLLLRRAPDASLEWRLVRVVVRITDVSRDGDAWRAEASLGAAGALPIAGVAAAGIASTDLEEGRMATITGIVRRAWPTASDQRFTVVPRSPDDLRLGPAPAAEGGSSGRRRYRGRIGRWRGYRQRCERRDRTAPRRLHRGWCASIARLGDLRRLSGGASGWAPPWRRARIRRSSSATVPVRPPSGSPTRCPRRTARSPPARWSTSRAPSRRPTEAPRRSWSPPRPTSPAPRASRCRPPTPVAFPVAGPEALTTDTTAPEAGGRPPVRPSPVHSSAAATLLLAALVLGAGVGLAQRSRRRGPVPAARSRAEGSA